MLRISVPIQGIGRAGWVAQPSAPQPTLGGEWFGFHPLTLNERMNDSDGQFWKVLGTCFSFGAASSLFNTLRQKNLPSLREIASTCCYAGASAVAIALCLIHFNEAKSNSLLYFFSLLAGLGSVDVLTAVWSKMLPGLINYFGQKFFGKNLIGDDGQSLPKPPDEVKP